MEVSLKIFMVIAAAVLLAPIPAEDWSPVGRYVVDEKTTRASLRVATIEHYAAHYGWDEDDPQTIQRMLPIIEDEAFITKAGKDLWDMRIVFLDDGTSLTERLDGSDSDTGTWSISGRHVIITQEKSIWHFVLTAPQRLAYVTEGCHVYMRQENPAVHNDRQ